MYTLTEPGGHRHRRRTSLIFALLAFAMASASHAQTSATARIFHIAAGSLEAALNQFTTQSGLQVLYDPAVVMGLSARQYDDTVPPARALATLLRGTGLTYQFSDAGTVVIKRPAAAPRSKQAAPKKVEREKSVAELSSVTIVGTLLKNVTPTSPVISFGQEDIERGGYTTLQDLMARIPQNFGSSTAATGASNGNLGLTTQMDLRGLGPEATLVLVDGRRVGGAAGNQGQAFDINMIPAGAVEHVDILTDGASALYGSDAIGGVVNIVLRKDFTGSETNVQYGVSDGSRQERMVSQLLGTTWATGHVMLAVQYDYQGAITYRSLGITSLDFSNQGGGNFETPGYGSPGTVYPLSFFTSGMPFSTLTGPGGTPVYSAALPPGNGRNLQLSQLGLNQMTNLNAVPVDAAPAQTNKSIFITGEQAIGSVTLFADGMFSDRLSQYAQTPDVEQLVVPTTNAFTPFAEPVVVGYEMNEFGPITVSPDSNGGFINTGVRGGFGQSTWSWSLVGSVYRDKFDTTVSAIDDDALDDRLASSDPSYAFNPFGDGSGQPPGLVAALKTHYDYKGTSDMDDIAAQTQGKLFSSPGGPAQLVTGIEHRHESMEMYTAEPGEPNVVQFPGATRDIEAAYAEANVPLFGAPNARPGWRALDLSLAGRIEHYSDFGFTANPKLGVLWKPGSPLTLKANWGKSFRAPELSELAAMTSVVPGYPIYDPHAPGGPATVYVNYIYGGNRNLKPERANTLSLSAEYHPAWLSGMRLSAGYYHVDYTQRIRGVADGISPDYLLGIESSLPPGIIQRNSAGQLVALDLSDINSAWTKIAGFDLNADYAWAPGALGYFHAGLAATVFTQYLEELIQGSPVLDLRGTVGNPPRWRGKLDLAWNRGHWGATASVNYSSGLYNTDDTPGILRRDVASQTTVDAQVSYAPDDARSASLRGLTVRLGVLNLFDRAPPFVDGPEFDGIDPRSALIGGRTVYLRLSEDLGEASQ
jgi:iron complex outermembrane recepter protein